MSSAEMRESSVAASGPMTDMTEYALVTSTSAANSPSPICLLIQSASRVACAEPVRMKNESAPSRVMVRSLSNPPRSLSMAV